MDNIEKSQKERLVERFRAYLESGFTPEPAVDEIDQMSLFRELAGLKNEVRLESRQVKGALDSFRQAFTSLDSSQQDIVQMMRTKKQQDSEMARHILTPAITGLIELYDRVSAGLAVQPPEPTFFERLLPSCKRYSKSLERHLEGQLIIAGRILELLERCGVSTISSEAKIFDPISMKAVSFASDTRRANNIVLEESRKGFFLEEKIIRPAEVVVNKIEE